MDCFNNDLEKFKEFIKHNIRIGYLKESMSIEELLVYIKNVQTRYISIQNEVSKIAEGKLKGE